VSEFQARLQWLGSPDTEATVDVLERDASARFRRAALTWAVTWACAVAAVFLPLLHFVLVPGLLIAGPVLAMQRSRERYQLLRARGRCPGCGGAIDESMQSAVKAGLTLRCPSCRRAVTLGLPDELLKPAR